jgi:hypothetical protein
VEKQLENVGIANEKRKGHQGGGYLVANKLRLIKHEDDNREEEASALSDDVIFYS